MEETKVQLEYLKKQKFELLEGEGVRKGTYTVKVTNKRDRKMSRDELEFAEVTVDPEGSFTGLPE